MMNYLEAVARYRRLRAALIDAIKGDEPPEVVSGILAAIFDAEATMIAAFLDATK